MSMLTGTNLVYTKQYNLRIVHEVIRVFGPLSRAEIARHTELTVQTISNLVKELIASGLVYEADRRQEGRGAPSTTLALNPSGAYAIGLDLDRDHLTGVLVDLSGTVRQRMHVELDFPTPTEALELLVETAETLIAREGLKRESVWGVGIGIPGPMQQDEEGKDYVVNPKAFPGWHRVPLASWARERLGMPVYLENNATAAAIGEKWYGAGQQIRTFFYIYFGSGLGGGLVLGGQPYEGFTGNAGELAATGTDGPLELPRRRPGPTRRGAGAPRIRPRGSGLRACRVRRRRRPAEAPRRAPRGGPAAETPERAGQAWGHPGLPGRSPRDERGHRGHLRDPDRGAGSGSDGSGVVRSPDGLHPPGT